MNTEMTEFFDETGKCTDNLIDLALGAMFGVVIGDMAG